MTSELLVGFLDEGLKLVKVVTVPVLKQDQQGKERNISLTYDIDIGSRASVTTSFDHLTEPVQALTGVGARRNRGKSFFEGLAQVSIYYFH